MLLGEEEEEEDNLWARSKTSSYNLIQKCVTTFLYLSLWEDTLRFEKMLDAKSKNGYREKIH